MKLKNKKTGEIREFTYNESYNEFRVYKSDGIFYKTYGSLAELCDEWEDYKELKGFWTIESDGNIQYITDDMLYTEYVNGTDFMACCKQIGSYFETRKEAEKAIKKLKALTRLENKGFRFTCWYGGSKNIDFEITSLENGTFIPRQICDDLDILFGGEE